MLTKKCSMCEKDLPIDKFYKRKGGKFGVGSWCKECSYKYVVKWRKTDKGIKQIVKDNNARRQTSQRLMHELKVNGCAICGYKRSVHSLDFHHANPNDKKFGLTYSSMILYSNQKICNELSKCILLCKNCHGEITELERKRMIVNQSR